MTRWFFGLTLDAANGDPDDSKTARRLIVVVVLAVLSLVAGAAIWHWQIPPTLTPLGGVESPLEVKP